MDKKERKRADILCRLPLICVTHNIFLRNGQILKSSEQ